MRHRLAIYLEPDGWNNLTAALGRLIEDPIRPRTDRGRFRVSPILLLLAVLSAFSLVVVLYFSLVRP
ncbi:MAG TPA: hypothetical protein VFR24_04520 [Candidatus Angelobacter sp.]|nr:hypothetical protein [Candidatus Angelobacter sp.]